MIDLSRLSFDPKVLVEPLRPDRRLVFWLPEDDKLSGCWDRITTASPDQAIREDGCLLLPATSHRTKIIEAHAFWNRLADWLRGRTREKRWTMPDGREVERCGERRADLVLIWPETFQADFDEKLLRSRWPGLTSCRLIGEPLALVAGDLLNGMRMRKSSNRLSDPEEPATSVELALQNLETARQTADPRREVAALTDLAIVATNAGKGREAVHSLRQALQAARGLGDVATELDILNNLGAAYLGLAELQPALAAYQAGLSLARTAGDGYAEKLLVEGTAQTLAGLGDVQGAYDLLTQALAMARRAGDHQQESRLLWRLAILLAEIGRRDEALAFAEDSVALLRRLARPEAAWYSAQLQRYRTDQSGGLPAASPTPSSQPVTGPGLLRMALSATAAMMKFIGSGMKQAPTDVAHARLKTCQSCEHHTGLRCRICGCFTNVKTRMDHERCPIGKWSG